jgi:O-methyltransferase
VGSNSLIEKAATRCNYDHIAGDYLEFGTYRGRSALNAYRALASTFENRLANETTLMSPEQKAKCEKQWAEMRFILFDSFRGLPNMDGIDLDGDDFLPGQYACSKDEVLANLKNNNVDMTKLRTVEGWYKDTCVPSTKESLGIESASICWIDCDIYQSTAEVLSFLKDLIVDGTILVFDDWFCFRGSPYRGQQRAFREFREQMPGWVFHEFQREASARIAFFCNRVLD